MKAIVYAGSEIITGDDIAIAVLRYCEALAGSVVAEVIEIPVRNPDGALSRATFLVGPSSQMFARDVASPFEEVVDAETMRRLAERTRAQRTVADSSGAGHDRDRNGATEKLGRRPLRIPEDPCGCWGAPHGDGPAAKRLDRIRNGGRG